MIEDFIFAVFAVAIIITFFVMLVRRPSERRDEKFERRKW